MKNKILLASAFAVLLGFGPAAANMWRHNMTDAQRSCVERYTCHANESVERCTKRARDDCGVTKSRR